MNKCIFDALDLKMSTDKTKSLLDVAMDVRKEHQDELEKKAAVTDVPESEQTSVEEPPDAPDVT